MRCKKIIKSISLLLLSVAMPSMAEDYNILVKNETTRNSGANLYVQVQTTGARTGIGGGRTQTSRCTALSSYEDGSFYLHQAMEEAQNPKITFYTGSSCRASTSIGSISPLEGPEATATDLIFTITDAGVTKANSTEPITAPAATTPGGDTRPGGPGGGPGGQTTPTAKKKVIRFFTPWDNTSAILYVAGGDSAIMKAIDNYCGWFQAAINPPEGSLQVYFKQTIGHYYVSDIMYFKTSPATQGILLSLDSAAAESDTIWVKANKTGATTVTPKYPGILGDCPVKKLPVMMFDWLHGTKGDGDIKTTTNRRDSTVTTSYANGAKDQDPDFGPMYATSNDFGSGGCGGSNAKDSKNRGYMAGMVEQTLGPNGVPVRAANFPENCKITEHLNNWFLPQVVAEKNGQPLTNATCRSIELNLDSNGLWLGQKDNKSPEGGLFLLDDFQYLDDEQTVKNPFYDNFTGNGKRHNYGFTMKIQATFEYIPGQYFEFFGDDDVWVFINNKLVVDIGGQHQQVLGAVDLDTLGLQEGVNYPFHIFYAERHTSESNFMMRTSIDLKTEASLFYEDLSANGILDYKLYQIIRKQALACDFSASASTTKDTVEAPSNFMLFGSGAYAEGVPLDSAGVWFGGITINKDYTGFTINTEEIRQKRTLPPGTYQLKFSLRKDESQSDDIWFTIDKYDSPTINYAIVDAKNNWKLIGNEVDGTVDTLGKWVNTRYTVNIAFLEEWATFDDMVYVNTSNPALIPCDENGNRISTVTMKNGRGTFYVKATAPVQDVTLIVGSSDETQTAAWRHISFMEPPVPQVVFACIFDRDGDGRGDSVYAKLSKPAGRIDANLVQMDSVVLEFGEKFAAVKKENVKTNDADSTMTITSPGTGGFGSVPFTGGAESIYSGKITPFWRYQGAPINLTSDLTDSIGPVITAADISYSDDGSTVLSLTFSEGLDCESDIDAQYFKYYFKSSNSERDDIAPDILAKESKSKWRLIFRASNNDKDNIPVMGDSIKMVEGIHIDLLHRSTDPRNPFVRIAGEQNVVVTSAPVVTIGEKDESREIIRSKEPTIPKVVHSDKPMTAKEVAEEFGAQGHFLGDLSLSSMVSDEVTNLQSAIKNANAKIVEKEGKTLPDLINEKGKDAVNKQYHLGDEIMNAIESGILSTEEIRDIANGNSATIAEVTKKLVEKTKLEYQTMYFTSLGVFVNSTTGSFTCSDPKVYNGNCLDSNNDGKLFLAWNMRSKEGRMVGTGVYIARLSYKIFIGNKVVVNRTQDFLWGVRHGRTQGFELDINLP